MGSRHQVAIIQFSILASLDNKITAWKSKGLSDKITKPPAASNNALAALNHISTKLRVKFDESCLKQEKVTFSHKQMVNIYNDYEIILWAFTV